MIRERVYTNLFIGLALSLLLHTSLLLWGPQFSLPTSLLHPAPEVEVQLREWPAPPAPPPQETVELEPVPPTVATPVPPAKPLVPPNTQVLEEAMQLALAAGPSGRVEVKLPERLPPPPTLAVESDPLQLAEQLRASTQEALPIPRLVDVAVLPALPPPERQPTEARDLPPLPALTPPTRREPTLTRPATLTVPSTQVTAVIQGPASERRVIFQPPPPSVPVESESSIELRFWILPNGAVGRVVPVKKSDPRLEAIVISYLRHWRFTPLPPDSPQDEQWGIIPFKFRIR